MMYFPLATPLISRKTTKATTMRKMVEGSEAVYRAFTSAKESEPMSAADEYREKLWLTGSIETPLFVVVVRH